MEILLYLGLAMIAGLLFTRLTRLVHLPNVTAYLIAGVLIGPGVLNLLNADAVSSFSLITSTALGFIAFSIGDQFKLSTLKSIGKPALIITVLESVGAVALVDTVTILCGFPKAMCVTLGALAASTAPAATLMVVRQYKADGPLTRMLLPVVAADDATGLIAYSISINIAIAMVNNEAFSVYSTLCVPLMQIAAALGIGALLGIILGLSHRYFRSHTNRMSIAIALIFLGVALADQWGLSSLLLCMAMGALYVNSNKDSERVLTSIDDWTYPLFMLFFVISGASLDLGALPKVGLLGIIYVVTRFTGKWIGSYIGAAMTKQPDVIKKNLGFSLMPQAGVAIGMATLALQQLPGYGAQVQTVILAATLIYELIGPIATKFALNRAGEIHAA
ncbi:MAG: cation:proton antiporter [Solobacterium sp.]|jgi:Kef-type K+ transport system membrane component KefB|nr:cation:proton antiporter [Solobacterium sp.]MCH4206608.1 cation:proton antiporter [Solobacterium sp.]MCH4227780.1 cation:proton antiporter [Solobacterium sp.]MCH4283328.1 cation:proton antiporter [Solobacterium sp.]